MRIFWGSIITSFLLGVILSSIYNSQTDYDEPASTQSTVDVVLDLGNSEVVGWEIIYLSPEDFRNRYFELTGEYPPEMK